MPLYQRVAGQAAKEELAKKQAADVAADRQDRQSGKKSGPTDYNAKIKTIEEFAKQNQYDPDEIKYKAAVQTVRDNFNNEPISDDKMKEAIDSELSKLKASKSGREMRGENGFTDAINFGKNAINGLTGFIGDIGDASVKGWASLIDPIAPELAKDMRNAPAKEFVQGLADMGIDVGLTALGPVGWAALAGKTALQQSDNIADAFASATGNLDPITRESMDEGEGLAKGLTAAGMIGLSAVPAVGKVANIFKKVKGIDKQLKGLDKAEDVAEEAVEAATKSEAKAAAEAVTDATEGVAEKSAGKTIKEAVDEQADDIVENVADAPISKDIVALGNGKAPKKTSSQQEAMRQVYEELKKIFEGPNAGKAASDVIELEAVPINGELVHMPAELAEQAKALNGMRGQAKQLPGNIPSEAAQLAKVDAAGELANAPEAITGVLAKQAPKASGKAEASNVAKMASDAKVADKADDAVEKAVEELSEREQLLNERAKYLKFFRTGKLDRELAKEQSDIGRLKAFERKVKRLEKKGKDPVKEFDPDSVKSKAMGALKSGTQSIAAGSLAGGAGPALSSLYRGGAIGDPLMEETGKENLGTEAMLAGVGTTAAKPFMVSPLGKRQSFGQVIPALALAALNGIKMTDRDYHNNRKRGEGIDDDAQFAAMRWGK